MPAGSWGAECSPDNMKPRTPLIIAKHTQESIHSHSQDFIHIIDPRHLFLRCDGEVGLRVLPSEDSTLTGG